MAIEIPDRAVGGGIAPGAKRTALGNIERGRNVWHIAKPSSRNVQKEELLQMQSAAKQKGSGEVRHTRTQISHGRVIQVVSVFPKQARKTPEDKLKALVDLELQQGKLCA